jgi:hypothetical protein
MREYGKNPNHSRVKFFEFKGERRTIHDWSRRLGLTYQCVQSRLKQGTPLDAPKSRAGRPNGKG